MKKEKNEHVLLRKLTVTALILVIYIAGRQWPLFAVDLAYYQTGSVDAQYILGMTVSGDHNRISVFALGILPYMIASIFTMAVTVVRKTGSKSKFSANKMKYLLYGITLLIASLQAVFAVYPMRFISTPISDWAVRGIAGAELVSGAMLIVWLIEINKDHGIGGQSVLILINIFGSIWMMVQGHEIRQLFVPICITVAAAAVTLIMEQAEIRIPVQRIFIHNIYKDKNYIAIKYNPIGVLPIMFSTSLFMLLQMGAKLLHYVFPGTEPLRRIVMGLELATPVGIAVYMGIVYFLTIALSMALLNPMEISQQMRKNNDSIPGICAGKPTQRRLVRIVLSASLLSATIMGGCVSVSLYLQIRWNLDPGLMMLPSMVMMLTSICTSFFRELKTAVSYECYRIFL